MKEYAYSLGVRILGSFCCFSFIGLGVYCSFFDVSNSMSTRVVGLLSTLFALMAFLALLRGKIFISDEKLQYFCDFFLFKTNQEIAWSNIKCISTDYFFVPQFCIFKIIGKTNEGRNKIDFPVRSFPSELFKDIFERVPATTKLDLYPWLRKELIKKGVNLNRFSDDSGNS